MLRADHVHPGVHAFPSVDNAPLQRTLPELGFTLIEECTFEYPKDHFMQCNDWYLDLS